MTMMSRVRVTLCATALAGGVVACTSQPAAKPAHIQPAATQQDVAEQAREFRNDAYALGQMAQRREMEAEVLAREVGEDDPRVQDKRRLAKDLRVAADEAERQARALRGSVPHGMVQ